MGLLDFLSSGQAPSTADAQGQQPAMGGFQDFLKSPQAMAMASALLKAGAVSPRPINMSEAFGGALDAGQKAITKDIQNQYYKSLVTDQQFKSQQRERELQASKEIGELTGSPAKNPNQVGMIFPQQHYKGTGLLGGEITMPEYKTRVMGSLGKAGQWKEALGLLGGGEYGSPVQALDANGKPIFVVTDKQGNVKTLDGVMPIPKKGMSLTQGADGALEFSNGGWDTPGSGISTPTNKTIGAMQGDIEGSLQSLDKLDQIAKDYNKNYLTYSGEMRSKTGSIINKLTGSSYDKQFIQGATKFRTGVEQLFNTYRKEITGAAAAVKELELLKQSMLNKDMSPVEFEAAYDQFRGGIERALRIKQKLLGEGVPLGSKEFGQRLDAEYSAGGGQAAGRAGLGATGQVMIKTPDGRTMAFPSDKIDEAIKLGAQRIS